MLENNEKILDDLENIKGKLKEKAKAMYEK